MNASTHHRSPITPHAGTSHGQALAASLPHPMPAAARTALRLLKELRYGVLTLQLPDGSHHRFGQIHASDGTPHATATPHATLILHNWKVFGATLKSGDIGFAEAFIAGDWSSPDLVALLQLFSANRKPLEALVYGTWLGRLLYRLRHLRQHNSRRNSRKNIHAHYDLGNAFYRLWLDETMNYSSAWFAGDYGADLATAQTAKVRRALDQTGVGAGHRVLEIGCGWGALAEEATLRRGASVVGVTLSNEQLAYANARLAAAGVTTGPQQSADLRLQDYRDIADAPFDAICSIEMIEAVGQQYWPSYFVTLSRLLKPGGKACIQSIVIDDALFARYAASTDFIQQYIFPGGCLPCPREFVQAAEAAGLELECTFAFGLDYAETLRRWRLQFLSCQSDVLALGFDTRFLLIWTFYLAYCEAAFRSGDIDLIQYTLRKPA